MYMTFEKIREFIRIKYQIGVLSIGMLCTDNENKHIHNNIHINLNANRSRLRDLYLNIYE